jgi:hypothetical protein
MAYNRVIREGVCPCKVTLAQACTVGQLLGYSSGWKLALATVASVIEPVLVAGEPGEIGDVITAYQMAVVEDLDAPYTAGATQYCGETGNGGAGETTQTAPSTSNDLVAKVGVALSTSQIFVNLFFASALSRLHA